MGIITSMYVPKWLLVLISLEPVERIPQLFSCTPAMGPKLSSLLSLNSLMAAM